MEEPRQNFLAITVIIAVRDEEKNLRECLCSVEGMDQVFVVDSHSTDRTSEVATELGAEVVQFEYDGGWPKKRNWALRELPIRNDWVLILDADERVADSLFGEIAQVIQQSRHADQETPMPALAVREKYSVACNDALERLWAESYR